MATAALVVALWLRLGEAFLSQTEGFLVQATLAFAAIAVMTFVAMGLYRGVWRYASIDDLDKDLYGKSEAGKGAAALLGTRVAYASQGWYLPKHKIIYSLGSYGQVGLSDLQTGISVVFMQDWEDNGVPKKYEETVARALFAIDQLSEKKNGARK